MIPYDRLLQRRQRVYERLVDKYLSEGMPFREAARKASDEAQDGVDRYCDEQMDERRLKDDRDS